MHYLVKILAACQGKFNPRMRSTKYRSQLVKGIVLLTILAAQTACVTKTNWNSYKTENLPEPQELTFNDSLFKPEGQLIAPALITQLSEAQQQDFYDYFYKPSNLNKPAYLRVSNYLTKIIRGFEYDTKTYTAEQTLTRKSGDCLSLALLTTAYAQLADLRISYHLMDNNPLFDLGDKNLLTSNHIRTILRNSQRQQRDGSRSSGLGGIKIDYFPSKSLEYIDNMPAEMPISMYYSNLAVEELARNEYDQAYAYALKALDISAENASALNTIGILHRRRGDNQNALRIYEYGARYLRHKAMFLRNKVVLLESQSRFSEAQQLLQEISEIPDEHPWQWIHAGRLAYREGNFSDALRFYEKALSISPNLHKIHVYSALAHYKLGRYKHSKQHLQLAIDNAPNGSAKGRYELKLAALK